MKTTQLILTFLITQSWLSSFGQVSTYDKLPTNATDLKFIEYHLPVKYLKVKVKYKLTDLMLVSKKMTADCKPDLEQCRQKEEIKHIYSVTINDPIQVAEVLVANPSPYFMEISKLGKGGKSYSVSINSDSNGIFTGINGNQEPVTAEIISGVFGIATTVISAVAKGIPFHAFTETVTKDDEIRTKETSVEVEQIMEIREGDQVFEAPTLDAKYSSIPVVKINIKNVSLDKAGKPFSYPSITFPVEGLIHLTPAFAQLTVSIENNLEVKSVKVIQQIIEVPQYGQPRPVPLPINKGNKTVTIAIDPATGLLTKYEDKKISNTKATFDKINGNIKDMGDAINSLREAQKNDKQTPEKATQAEIDRLKLENDLIQLKIENAKKKKALENGGDE